MEKLTGHEEYEELSNEPAFSKMVKEWKAYRSTGLSPAGIPALTARAEPAEAERDAAVEDLYEACRRSPCNNGICVKKNCTGNIIPCGFEWRGPQEVEKGGTP